MKSSYQIGGQGFFKVFYLSKSENALLGSNATSLDHDEILLDLTVVGEATHGIDGLVGQIVVGGGVVLDQLEAKTQVKKVNRK